MPKKFKQNDKNISDASEQVEMGNRYYNGDGVKQDFKKAVQWYKKAAKQGQRDAQYNLALCYLNGYGIEENEEKAMSLYFKAAERGHAQAQRALAASYYGGDGVEQDYEKTVYWAQQAAWQGEPGAQWILGMCYFEGDGIKQNDRKAAAWFRKAAQQGDKGAQFSLSRCYDDGMGVKKDAKKALYWLKKAAKKGYAYAQGKLGSHYYYGDDVNGIPVDYKKAEFWLKEAAKQNEADEDTLYLLSKFYDRNIAEHKLWLILAAQEGHEEAHRKLARAYRIDYENVKMEADELLSLCETGGIKSLSKYGVQYVAPNVRPPVVEMGLDKTEAFFKSPAFQKWHEKIKGEEYISLQPGLTDAEADEFATICRERYECHLPLGYLTFLKHMNGYIRTYEYVNPKKEISYFFDRNDNNLERGYYCDWNDPERRLKYLIIGRGDDEYYGYNLITGEYACLDYLGHFEYDFYSSFVDMFMAEARDEDMTEFFPEGFDDGYTKENGYRWRWFWDEKKSLIKNVDAFKKFKKLEDEDYSFKTTDLIFYKNFKLLRVWQLKPKPNVKTQYLIGGSDPEWTVIKLDGTLKVIYENNPKAGLVLNEETVVGYVKFVLENISDEEGPMLLLEEVDEHTFESMKVPDNLSEIAQVVRQAVVRKTGEGFELDATLLQAENEKVYRSIIVVSSDGILDVKKLELPTADKASDDPIGFDIPSDQIFCKKCKTTNYFYDDNALPFLCDYCGAELKTVQGKSNENG
jgi:TPR repeat protein